MNRVYWGLVLTFILSGCRANQESLQDFILHTQATATMHLSELQDNQIFQASEYAPLTTNKPFSLPEVVLVDAKDSPVKECWQPVRRKKNGKLEKFSLNQIQLKGVMVSGKKMSGIIQVSDGEVFPVNQGHYLGLNNGKVIDIKPNFLTIKETLPDGLGCWKQRKVKLALN